MNLAIAIHGYPGTGPAAVRHLPYWQKSGADLLIGISTTDGKCEWPEGMESVSIGRNAYIDGAHLPQRLIDTLRFLLLLPFDRLAIIEWDCLFFSPLPEFTGMCGFHAGNQSPGMRAHRYYHCPWAWDRDTAKLWLAEADKAVKEVADHEASPDVFLGWVAERAGIEVQQPWVGFSRNSLDLSGDLELAREARLNGANSMHGVKTERELNYITA